MLPLKTLQRAPRRASLRRPRSQQGELSLHDHGALSALVDLPDGRLRAASSPSPASRPPLRPQRHLPPRAPEDDCCLPRPGRLPRGHRPVLRPELHPDRFRPTSSKPPALPTLTDLSTHDVSILLTKLEHKNPHLSNKDELSLVAVFLATT